MRFKSFLLLMIGVLSLGKELECQQVLTKIGTWNAYVHLPAEYETTTKRYPVIVFVPGIGEVGTDAAKLLVNGPSRFVAQGNKMEFMVNGVLEKPIVISMQPPANWPNPPNLNRQLDSIVRRWRIDTNRLYITGLSMGASTWDSYIANENPRYASRIAAHVSMSSPPVTNAFYFTYFALKGGRWWGFEGTQDIRQMTRNRDAMNLAVPGSARYTLYVGGHGGWNTWYDPSWTENGESIYVWMLKQVRNPSLVINKLPVISAGRDQTVTLPVNSVTLNGTGRDPDGKVLTYAWTKLTGPTAGVIDQAGSAQTKVRNLAAGTYRFRLLTKDTTGGGSIDTVIVNVRVAVPKPTLKR